MKILPDGYLKWRNFLIRWIMIISVLFLTSYWFTKMPGSSYSGKFLPLTEKESTVAENLKKHVVMLSETIGERHIHSVHGYKNLKKASNYIFHEFEKIGYKPVVQKYKVWGKEVENIEATLKGNSDEIIIYGAHYDSVISCPAANDNGSGVAALIELARLYVKSKQLKTVKFVAFVNEEPPFYYTQNMGSYVYASEAFKRKDNIIAMFSLETIGYYSDEKGSQKYPLFQMLLS